MPPSPQPSPLAAGEGVLKQGLFFIPSPPIPSREGGFYITPISGISVIPRSKGHNRIYLF